MNIMMILAAIFAALAGAALIAAILGAPETAPETEPDTSPGRNTRLVPDEWDWTRAKYHEFVTMSVEHFSDNRPADLGGEGWRAQSGHEDKDDALGEWVDGCEWVIYCAAASKVLEYSSNDSAIEEIYCAEGIGRLMAEEGISGYNAAAAYFALQQDIRDDIDESEEGEDWAIGQEGAYNVPRLRGRVEALIQVSEIMDETGEGRRGHTSPVLSMSEAVEVETALDEAGIDADDLESVSWDEARQIERVIAEQQGVYWPPSVWKAAGDLGRESC